MRFFTVVAVLAGVVSALPGPVPQPDAPGTLVSFYVASFAPRERVGLT